MSSGNKGSGDGGQNGPSESVVNGAAAVIQIASHLAKSAVDLDGSLVPSSAVHLALRDPAARRELLEQVILQVAPNGVDEGVWLDWLKGGRSPFEQPLRKVASGSDGPTRLLARATPRVVSQEKKVARARAALEHEERELASVQAYETAAVHWHVVDQLADIVSPAFAMGPAWTVMRALSAYLSEGLAEAETFDLIGKEKERAVEAMRSARKSETALLMEVLDLGSGNDKFEADVRAAVLKVCKDWAKKRDKLMADGRRPRPADEVRKQAHPKGQADTGEVLAGLARPG